MNKIIAILFLLLYTHVNGQEPIKHKGFRYYPILTEYLHTKIDKSKFDAELNSYSKKATHVESMIKSTSNQLDLTDRIQNIINTYDVVVLPNHEIKINEKGLRLNSNQVIIFQENTVLKSIPNSKTHFAVLIVDEVENVKIYNANIIGERFEHLDTKGQWGMGIRIIASKDIQVINPKITEMWGDGIYIGGRRGIPSKNIEIHNAHLDHNRRNALSITSADGVKLIKPLVANSNGQSPKAGIDIEPNSNDDIINNIVIDSPICFYNPIYGIVVSLTRLPGVKPKEVNVEINSPLIVGGKYGIAVLGIYDNPNRNKITGTIKVKNLTTYYTALTIKEFLKPQYDIKINFSIMNIYHKSKNGEIYSNEEQLNKFIGNLKILK